MSIYHVAGITYSSELYHHGVKGQQWGLRRYQNEDGSLTDLGARRLGIVNRGLQTNMLGAQRQARLFGDTLPAEKKALNDELEQYEIGKEWRDLAESQDTYSGFGEVLSDRILSVQLSEDAKQVSKSVVEGRKKVEEVIKTNNVTTTEAKKKKKKKKKAAKKKSSTKKRVVEQKPKVKAKKKVQKPRTHGSVHTTDLEYAGTNATNNEVMDFLKRGGRR